MGQPPDDIRILDLAEPRLNDIQRGTIEAVGQISVTFSEDAVLGTAVKQTGLSDFGADDFHERLGVWLASVEEDSGLGPVGRLAAFNDCVRYAANRLRFEDLLKRHPEILDANEVFCRDPALVKQELTGLTSTESHLGQFLRDTKAWKGLFHDERRNTMCAFVRRCLGVHQ